MKLIEEARQFWRLWSVRVMAIPVLVAGAYATSPGVFIAMADYVPEQWRPMALFAGTIVMSGLGTWARLVKQPKKECPDG